MKSDDVTAMTALSLIAAIFYIAAFIYPGYHEANTEIEYTETFDVISYYPESNVMLVANGTGVMHEYYVCPHDCQLSDNNILVIGYKRAVYGSGYVESEYTAYINSSVIDSKQV